MHCIGSGCVHLISSRRWQKFILGVAEPMEYKAEVAARALGCGTRMGIQVALRCGNSDGAEVEVKAWVQQWPAEIAEDPRLYFIPCIAATTSEKCCCAEWPKRQTWGDGFALHCLGFLKCSGQAL